MLGFKQSHMLRLKTTMQPNVITKSLLWDSCMGGIRFGMIHPPLVSFLEK